MAKKKELETNIKKDLTVNGKTETFLFSISYKKNARGVVRNDQGIPIIERYYFRPTEDQKYRWPRLKEMRRSSLGKMLDEILEATEEYNPARKYFNDELDQYIIDVKKHGENPLKPTSYANCEMIVNAYIKPYFQGLTVKEVDDRPCRKMINALVEAGYSKSIIDKAYMYTNEFLEYLSLKDIIPKNWMKLVDKPRPDKIENKREELKKKQKKRHYLKNDEIRKIRKVLYSGYDTTQKTKKEGGTATHHWSVAQPEAFDLLLMTGVRVGELLALRYTDWDPEKQTLNINKGRVTYIIRENNQPKTITTETAPKNKASKSEIELLPGVNELLMRMKAKEPEGYEGYIVHDKNYNPLVVRSFQDRFKRVVEAAGLKGVTPHDFRHTFASIMSEQSGNNVLFMQKKLRHKDPTTTLNIYADLRPEAEEDITQNIVFPVINDPE